MPNNKKTPTFAANSIIFWYRHLKKLKNQYYVLKNQFSSGMSITAEQAVNEHIAYSLYRLLGVNVPDCFLINIGARDGAKPAILTQYLNGYADLSMRLGGKSAIQEINEKPTIEGRVKAYKDQLATQKIQIPDRGLLLIASIFLSDYDVIGCNYANVGLIKKQHGFQLIKIDPGCANFKDASSIADKISLDNPLLNKDYETELFNKPNILGNQHYLEFFSELPKNEIKLALEKLACISDEELTKHILRKEYKKWVDDEYLAHALKTLLVRKHELCSLVPIPTKESISQPLMAISPESKARIKTVHQIKRGNAKPFLVSLNEEKAEIPGKELFTPHKVEETSQTKIGAKC